MKSPTLLLLLPLILPSTLALVLRDMEPRHRPHHWGHNGTGYLPTGTGYLPTSTITLTITTTLTLPGNAFPSSSASPDFPTPTTIGVAQTTSVVATGDAPPPNSIPPLTLITLPTGVGGTAGNVSVSLTPNTIPPLTLIDVTSIPSTLAATAPIDAAPTPNDIPPVQLITLA
ncbi:hypothetical protein NX059_011856 [Plenodomus lindquistii]|nr:hypothetical protein NX059_011856 [Plenodomus lindquistii]